MAIAKTQTPFSVRKSRKRSPPPPLVVHASARVRRFERERRLRDLVRHPKLSCRVKNARFEVGIFFFLKKTPCSDCRPPSARSRAENKERRGGRARFTRGMASSDVDRGRATVARVRTGVSTRHRRLKERQGRAAKNALWNEQEHTKATQKSNQLGKLIVL